MEMEHILFRNRIRLDQSEHEVIGLSSTDGLKKLSQSMIADSHTVCEDDGGLILRERVPLNGIGAPDRRNPVNYPILR